MSLMIQNNVLSAISMTSVCSSQRIMKESLFPISLPSETWPTDIIIDYRSLSPSSPLLFLQEEKRKESSHNIGFKCKKYGMFDHYGTSVWLSKFSLTENLTLLLAIVTFIHHPSSLVPATLQHCRSPFSDRFRAEPFSVRCGSAAALKMWIRTKGSPIFP